MNEDIIKRFWNLMSRGMFEDAGKLMAENCVVFFPNTKEVFRGRDKYVKMNQKYPGRWIISIEKLLSNEDTVVSAAKVESEDKSSSFYDTAFFTIKNNVITEIAEYWGDNGEPPMWRIEEKLSQRY